MQINADLMASDLFPFSCCRSKMYHSRMFGHFVLEHLTMREYQNTRFPPYQCFIEVSVTIYQINKFDCVTDIYFQIVLSIEDGNDKSKI